MNTLNLPNIDVSTDALTYLRRLIDEQDMGDLALRLVVANPGLPSARCSLSFCEPDQAPADDVVLDLGQGLGLHVDADCADYLTEAAIDFEATDTGGKLSIKAPNIKGAPPAADAALAERIKWLIDAEVNPGLAAHGGFVTIAGVSDDGEVALRFGGGCHGCGMADVTLRDGIETRLREAFPEINRIVDATDHSTGTNPYY